MLRWRWHHLATPHCSITCGSATTVGTRPTQACSRSLMVESVTAGQSRQGQALHDAAKRWVQPCKRSITRGRCQCARSTKLCVVVQSTALRLFVDGMTIPGSLRGLSMIASLSWPSCDANWSFYDNRPCRFGSRCQVRRHLSLTRAPSKRPEPSTSLHEGTGGFSLSYRI